ncbi:Pentalenene oxygenase [Enhygromyxa salina]|uniref:Pentalenene oxygenase n=1 Tax=Enhygromyxa salina TaxID=215803 RepID=A0A2S9XYS8_9BACT|nr:cytochrome P450 [Enhygromyxa salina]PRP97911.1 Pentalenene oxygenase [Enhygromyxa salina]
MIEMIDYEAFGDLRAHRLPSGPRSRLLATLGIAGDVAGAMRSWKRRYGPTFTINEISGKMVLTSEPELVRKIFTAPESTFDGALPEAADIIIGPRSVAMSVGEQHQRLRKLLTPSFCASSLGPWGETIAATTRRVFRGGTAGQVFPCRSSMAELTTRVIVRIIFGANGQREEDRMYQTARNTMRAQHPFFLVTRHLQRDLGPFTPYRRYKLAAQKLDALLYERIARARTESPDEPNVLTSMACGRFEDGSSMSDIEIRDNLYSLLVAGYETTAYALTWAMYFLHRHPEALRRLRDELDTVGPDGDPVAFTQLPFLNATIDETLRICPPAPFTTRRLGKTWELGEWVIPPGTYVAPATYLLHHDENIWGDPENFRPERFLDHRPSPFEFLPFGGGAHRCLGAALSKFEAAVVLGTLLTSHEAELCSPNKVDYVRTTLTTGPKQDFPIRLSPRGPRQPHAGAGQRPEAATGCPFHS